mgnify:CR=1 FL=1
MEGQKNEPDINELKAYKPLFPLSPFFKDRDYVLSFVLNHRPTVQVSLTFC